MCVYVSECVLVCEREREREREREILMALHLPIESLKSRSGCVCVGGGSRCSSVVRAFAHGTMGRRIDPSWGGPIELFLVPVSAPRLV